MFAVSFVSDFLFQFQSPVECLNLNRSSQIIFNNIRYYVFVMLIIRGIFAVVVVHSGLLPEFKEGWVGE